MKLRATVRQATGATRHTYARMEHGVVVRGEYPTPAFVEIHTADDGSCFLLHFDANGRCQSDSWHETLEDAKDQADFEFRIVSDDWKQV